MARIGPNQDINDPTTILEVGKLFYDKSVDFGILQAISDTGDPDSTGPPVIPITIPLKLEDGSIYDLDSSRITPEFTVDESRLRQSVLNTYIDLAELFRDYWSTLKDSLINLSDYHDVSSSVITPVASGSIPPTPPGFETHASGSFGGISYDIDSILFSTDYPDTPIWSGHTPTNYNHNTYPQLLNVMNDLSGSFVDNSIDPVEEIYWWDRFFGAKQSFGASAPALATVFRLHDRFQLPSGPLSSRDFLQVVNPSDTDDKIINISLTADYSGFCGDVFASRSESVSLTILSSINDYNSFSSDNTTSVFDSQSFEGSFSGTRNINLSISKEVTIPPNKSVFIRTLGRILTTTPTNVGPVNLVGDMFTTITGQTTLESHAVVTVNYPNPGNNSANAW